MNVGWLFLLFLSWHSPVRADDGIYERVSARELAEVTHQHELSPMPPVKDQNGAGLCYAFSTAVAMEYHRCRVRKCTGYGSSDLISPLFLSQLSSASQESQSPREIRDGGYVDRILSNLKRYRSAIGEECAPSPPLMEFLSAQGGWNRAKEKFDRWKANRNCAQCRPDEINFQLPEEYFSRVKSALAGASFEQFLAGLFVPAKCRKDAIVTLPEFQDHIEVMSKPDEERQKAHLSKIEQLLLNDVPVLASVCTQMKNGECSSRHALVITGVRKNCVPRRECLVYFRVQNSYGQSWQEARNGGWIQAEPVLRSLEALSWVTAPGQVLAKKSWPGEREIVRREPVQPERRVRPVPGKGRTFEDDDEKQKFIQDCYDGDGTLEVIEGLYSCKK